jgi:hypothetical protein
MKQLMKRRVTAVVAITALASIGGAVNAAGAIAGGEPTACETVSLSFVQKTVGLPHSTLLRDHSNLEDTSGLEPSELPQAAHSECDIGLWGGKAPKTRAAIFAKARAGQATQVGVDAWAPNPESPFVDQWEGKGFNELTTGFLKGRLQLVLGLHGLAKSLNPQGDGYIGIGMTLKATGIAHGLEAAAGCWWDKGTSRAICLFTEEVEGKPVVDHLNALAKKIVPNFLGAP